MDDISNYRDSGLLMVSFISLSLAGQTTTFHVNLRWLVAFLNLEGELMQKFYLAGSLAVSTIH